MQVLRERAGLTQLLLLVELQRTRHTTLRSLAEELDITTQAVSQHVAELQRMGLLRASRGSYALTPKGTQLLLERVAELKGFFDLAYQRVRAIERCAAVARTKVEAGEAVGLFMEQGLLVARARKPSASRGIAAHRAAPGELVQVHALEGLVELQPGKLVVLEVPAAGGPRTRGAAKALRGWLARQRPAFDRVAAVGTEAQALALAARVTDPLFFAPVQAGHHAAQLGLRVAILAAPDQARFVSSELDRLDAQAFERVGYEMRTLRGGA